MQEACKMRLQFIRCPSRIQIRVTATKLHFHGHLSFLSSGFHIHTFSYSCKYFSKKTNCLPDLKRIPVQLRLRQQQVDNICKANFSSSPTIFRRMGVADDLTTNGEFARKASQFRNFISKNGEFPPEANRYHLYISHACPWAHRTLIVRKLKGLEDIIGLSVVHYLMLEKGWEFRDTSDDPGCIPDTINNFKFASQLYLQSDPEYKGRFTVPILYDKTTKKIVNNESSEIIRMFNKEFNEFAKNPELDLCPQELLGEIDQLNEFIYNGINNGVYKAGFATTQAAYEPNAKLVRDSLLKMEKRLEDNDKNKKGPFLFGEKFTETDIRLFTSLIRYDAVYYFHFKCNLIAVKDLPNLSKWLKIVYEKDGIGQTVNMEHVKRHYYMSHLMINPTGVVPLYSGPNFVN